MFCFRVVKNNEISLMGDFYRLFPLFLSLVLMFPLMTLNWAARVCSVNFSVSLALPNCRHCSGEAKVRENRETANGKLCKDREKMFPSFRRQIFTKASPEPNPFLFQRFSRFSRQRAVALSLSLLFPISNNSSTNTQGGTCDLPPWKKLNSKCKFVSALSRQSEDSKELRDTVVPLTTAK